MKCIACGFDSRYKDRHERDGKCPGCGKRFAFEPRAGAPITDLGFQRAIDAVSAKGHVNWGVEHLYYEVCRRLHRAARWKRRWRWVLLGLAAPLFVVAATYGAWVFVIMLSVLGIGVCWWGFATSTQTVALSSADFSQMWEKWTKTHPDHSKGLILRKEPLPRSRPAERDIPLYSFDRAVICDRARTVDLLLANNFHFENNCAVLSIDGYPPGPFATVREMLKRNPRLQVFALHDATEAGCRMASRLATETEWFKGQAKIVDVGLRPAHGRVFTGLWLGAQAQRLSPGHGITAPEARWLSRHILELAAIRPEQVLKRLYRAINDTPARRPRRDPGDGSGGGGDGGGGASGQPGATSAHEGEFGGAGASGAWDTADGSSGVTFAGGAFGTDAGDMDGDGDGSG